MYAAEQVSAAAPGISFEPAKTNILPKSPLLARCFRTGSKFFASLSVRISALISILSSKKCGIAISST
jgi:hypothetical protein